LKVSTNVKIAMQCFENFGGEMPQMPPLVARLGLCTSLYILRLFTDNWNIIQQVSYFRRRLCQCDKQTPDVNSFDSRRMDRI